MRTRNSPTQFVETGTDAPVKAVCLAMVLAIVALAARIASIW